MSFLLGPSSSLNCLTFCHPASCLLPAEYSGADADSRLRFCSHGARSGCRFSATAVAPVLSCEDFSNISLCLVLPLCLLRFGAGAPAYALVPPEAERRLSGQRRPSC